MRESLKDRLIEIYSGQIPPERKQPRMRAVAPVARRGAAQQPDANFPRRAPRPAARLSLTKRVFYGWLGVLCIMAGLFLAGVALFILVALFKA